MSINKFKHNYKAIYPQLRRKKKVLRVLKTSDRKMEYMGRDQKVGRWVKDPKTGEHVYRPAVEVSLEYLDEIQHPLVGTYGSVEDIVENADLHERLYAALASLSAKERRLIEKIYFKNRFEHQVAKTLGITQSAVHRRKKKVLQKLEKMLR